MLGGLPSTGSAAIGISAKVSPSMILELSVLYVERFLPMIHLSVINPIYSVCN